MRQGETVEGREGIMGYRSHRMRRETDETITVTENCIVW